MHSKAISVGAGGLVLFCYQKSVFLPILFFK